MYRTLLVTYCALSAALLLFLGGCSSSSDTPHITLPPALFISDMRNTRLVQTTDMTGADWTALGVPASSVGYPNGIAYDATGRLFVADHDNNCIARVNDITGAGWLADTTDVDATDIAVTTNNVVYIADRGHDRIVREATFGATPTTFGSTGAGANQFDQIYGMWVTDGGTIYVADTGNHRLVRFTNMTGAGWTTFGTFGEFTNQFMTISGVCVPGDGYIYIADSGNNCIMRVNESDFGGWTTFGTMGSGVNQFSLPTDVVVDEGHIYVADSGNDRIVQIDDMTGANWTTFGGLLSDKFSTPTNISVR